MMEAKQNRSRFLFTIFHILHACVAIGLVIALVSNQLVNESRFEKLERNVDNKCGKCGIDATQMDDVGKSNNPITENENNRLIGKTDKMTLHRHQGELHNDANSTTGQSQYVNNTTNIEGVLKSTKPTIATMTGIVMKGRVLSEDSLDESQEKHRNSSELESADKMLTNLLGKDKKYFISCLEPLRVIIENQVTTTKTDENKVQGCQLLRGDPGERGERGVMGLKGCSGTSFAPPSFQSSPQYLVFNEGDPAVLTCNATANPSAQVTWYHDDKRLFRQGKNVSDLYIIENRVVISKEASTRTHTCPSEIPHPVTQSTLVIKKTRGSDSGNYVCMANNMMGVVTYEITVLVQVYVRCDAMPSSITAVQGNDVQLRCRASGVPKPIITWYRKDGGPMPNRYNDIGRDLHIYDISKEEEGTFVCSAANVLGSKTTEANITVNVPPKITSFLNQSITINEKQTLVLPCNFTGYPSPEIRWSKIKGSLPEGRYVYDSHMLKISGVKYEDQGEYVCTANNTAGTAVTKTTIIVQVAPKITKRPNTTEYGYRGKFKTLWFEVYAFPAAKITWTKSNNEEINHGRFQRRNGSLCIENIKYTDTGYYQATARNILGEVKSTTFLVVRDPVPALIRSKQLFQTISIKEGKNFTKTCNAVGVPTPKMVWKHHSSIITSVTSLSLPLNIINVGSQHAGRYTCTVTNEFGFEEQRFDLRVIERWAKLVQPRRYGFYHRYGPHRTTSRSTGMVMSQNYPSHYPRSSSLKWQLKSNVKISIYFHTFDTELCCDKVRIYDGNSTSSPLLGEFSGTTLPPNITSSSEDLFLKFNADGTKERKGFLISYKAVG